MAAVAVHLLLPHPQGRIASVGFGGAEADRNRVTPAGSAAARFDVLCGPEKIPEHMTGEARATSCPECIAHVRFPEVYKQQTGKDYIPPEPPVEVQTPPSFDVPITPDG